MTMLPGLGDRLQPRGEVRLGADDRVVHPVVAAEIADVAEAGIDAHAHAERLLDASLRHFALSWRSRCCISSAMRRQAWASSASPLVSGSPKKISIASPMNLSIVPPCRSAIVRHLGEIFIEQLRDLLRLQPLGGRRKVLDVGEEDRQLLALGLDGDVLLAAEDALVDLRRKIARDLHRQRREELVGRLQLAFMPWIVSACRRCTR